VFTLLLVTVGMSPDDAVAAIRSLVDRSGEYPLQLLVDTAEDLEMRRAVEPTVAGLPFLCRTFGKVDNAPELWACADAVALKPVDYLVSRALGYGRPLVVIEPDGPHGRALAGELLRREVAVVAPEPGDLASAMDAALGPQTRKRFASNAQTHSRSGAVDRVTRALAQLAKTG
jgi:hypothetical protein